MKVSVLSEYAYKNIPNNIRSNLPIIRRAKYHNIAIKQNVDKTWSIVDE